MKSESVSSRSILLLGGSLAVFLVTLGSFFAVGCGGNGGAGTTFSGSTTVTLLATGTANDRWTFFSAGVDSLTLTSQSGQTVSLLTMPAGTNFMHVNGTVEPLVTVSVPQGIYTAATASLSGVGFDCVSLGPDGSGIANSIYAYNVPIPASEVTVSLPKPITVAGESMGLLLDFQVSKSLTFPSNCYSDGIVSYSIKPAFILTSIAVPGPATNNANGKAVNHLGLVTSIDTGGARFSVNAEYGPSWEVTANASTVYQGITDFSQTISGMSVDIDAAVQPDGSMLATRIAVYDTNTIDLSVDVGPLLSTNATASCNGLSVPHALVVSGGETSWGYVPWVAHNPEWSYSNATFQTSGQFDNVQSLPFPASFTSSNMVAGQEVAITTHDSAHSITLNCSMSASTVTLIPQFINGTVAAISSEDGFTTYTVQLAPYDLFPTFATQPNQTTVLTNPGTVVVYADSDTQKLNTTPVAVGSVVRFYGLVFNDNGTLRMDCAQISDGVPE